MVRECLALLDRGRLDTLALLAFELLLARLDHPLEEDTSGHNLGKTRLYSGKVKTPIPPAQDTLARILLLKSEPLLLLLQVIRPHLEFLNLLLELAHLLLEDALHLVVLEVRIVHGALLVVLGAHEHGALLGDDGARVAVHAHQGELLVVLGALLSDDGALLGALLGRPLAYLDDFEGLSGNAQLALLVVELLLESRNLVEVAQRNLLRVVRQRPGRQAGTLETELPPGFERLRMRHSRPPPVLELLRSRLDAPLHERVHVRRENAPLFMGPEEHEVHGALLIVHSAFVPGEDDAVGFLQVGVQLVVRDAHLLAHDDQLGPLHPECGHPFLCTGTILFFQQHGEAVGDSACVEVADAVRLAPHLHRLAVQRLSGGEVALVRKQRGEVIHRGERVRMPIAKRLALPVQRLA
eukprot:scaffold17871_cov82-Phaeocystis_antarctica.AAC.14